ncbi:MAG: flagellar assembly peptidoglycan hydrolase FlgJ [Oxalobacter formigenes]|nr:flagellar assembly peptidoglycan hydrolase FlgJ [Oxalobacter formigenes]
MQKVQNIPDSMPVPAAGVMDNRGLYAIKAEAARNSTSPAAMKAAAQQFEALFLSTILKSMRASLPQDGLFTSQQTKLYTQLLDEEISQQVARQGLGLADQMLRQMVANGQLDAEETEPYLSKRRVMANAGDGLAAQAALALHNQPAPFNFTRKADETAAPEAAGKADKAAAQPEKAGRDVPALPPHARAFTEAMRPYAEEASRATGIPADFMLAQAALETGWGKRQIRLPDGSPSYNLFGIKANGWTGKTADAMTQEFENGRMVRKAEKFRAYDSYADSFKDYARLLSGNPRYREAAAAQDPAAFAYGLQRAGYATDPAYGGKLVRVIGQVRQG